MQAYAIAAWDRLTSGAELQWIETMLAPDLETVQRHVEAIAPALVGAPPWGIAAFEVWGGVGRAPLATWTPEHGWSR